MVYLPLPAESTYGDVELDFIDLEPPGLLPQDQNSVWGQIRHTLAEHMQGNLVDKLDEWYNNLDPSTALVGDFPEWEEQLGIPPIPHDYVTGVPESFRRALIVSRFEKGPFSRARRDRVIEQFLAATFGTPVFFSPDGLLLDAAGTPLYAETAVVKSSYRVYEDISNFAYAVWIPNTITPNTASLLRELKRITPAPVSANVTIDNSQAEISDYAKAVKNHNPVAYFRLDNLAGATTPDSSYYANTATVVGSPATLAAPGLLVTAAGGDKALDADGVDDSINVPTSTQLNNIKRGYAITGLFNCDTLPASSHMRPIISWDVNATYLAVQNNGALLASFGHGVDGHTILTAAGLISAGTKYHFVLNRVGDTWALWVNGVKRVTSATWTGDSRLDGAWRMGRFNAGDLFDGKIDEIAIMDHSLTDAQITELYQQSLGNTI